MTAAVFEPGSGLVVPALASEECLVCRDCTAVFPAAQVDGDIGEIVRRCGVAACPQCGGAQGFGRCVTDSPLLAKRRSMADRWSSEIAGFGFTPLPTLLLTHTRDLGIKSTDLAVIAALENHDWSINRYGVYPTQVTIAREAGRRLTATKTALRRLECAGLIEVTKRVRRNGRRTSNGYTRHGLQRALALIAQNRGNGRDDTDGLAELRDELAANGEREFNLRTTSSPDHESESDPEAVQAPTGQTTTTPSSENPGRDNNLFRGRNPTNPRLGRSA